MKKFMLSTRLRNSICLSLMLIMLLAHFSCSNQEDKVYKPTYTKQSAIQQNTYIFGIHPLHNPERLHEIFGPVIEYLSKQIPNAEFRLEASRNYADFEKKLYSGKFHFALPNPYQTLKSLSHGYRVFGKMADDENFCGIILIRNDSPIEKISDLKGKAISFPAPTALAATMMPQFFLHSEGLDVMNEIDCQYVGSQESSIMSVYLGNTAAGATWPPPWEAFKKERPELSKELHIQWKTTSLINNGLVVKMDVDSNLVAEVSSILFSLHEFPEGQKWLKRMDLSKFEKADNEKYRIIEDFLQQFEAKIRKIE